MSFKVVILSGRAANLVPCVQALLQNEPALPPEHIIVVDDGARGQAEAYLPPLTWVKGVKPFVFAGNANLGFRAAGSDAILLNDDARLMTYQGFTGLSCLLRGHPELGICSAGILGAVNNANQLPFGRSHLRIEPRTLAFVCVMVPWAVYQRLGPLDERFVGYGFEDNDYCTRVLMAGLKLGVWDGCVVDHSGHLPSTFRTRGDFQALLGQNRRIFQAKWGWDAFFGPPATHRTAFAALPATRCQAKKPDLTGRCVDLLYLACNRLEFTRESFTTMLANTDWERVHELFIMDDGSKDGTWEWLNAQAKEAPAPTRCVRTSFGSPVAVMAHFIELASAPVLAKIDNDVMLPPGWLRLSLDVLADHPELSFLGLEAMIPLASDPDLRRSYETAQFISGLGLYRRAAFSRSRPAPQERWFGFEAWQMSQGPGLVRGWIKPALPLFLLDRLPFEPWKSLTQMYVRVGWQRPWPAYDNSSPLWHWRWPAQHTPATPKASRPVRFLGALRVKNEAAHIQEVISQALHLCELIMVLDDHSSDETAAICQSFGERVVVLTSPFEGLNESRDKNFLLGRICEANPEWVLWIDGDEVLERSGPEILRQAARQGGNSVAGYSLKIAYLWDNPQQVRVDGIFGQFWRPSFFRLRGQPAGTLHFPETDGKANFHCGNVPQGLVGSVAHLDVRLKHYGYMTKAQRLTKYHWYTTADPNNAAEDSYRHLAEIPGAGHAPGPPQLVPWVD
jgi:glycosyltransferase involved in cell wall biosynthesis